MVNNDFNKTQYAHNAAAYIRSNLDGGIGGKTPEERIALLRQFLPEGRSVFEIGSASGDEALKLQDAGYHVTASDFVEEFVDTLTEKGLNSVLFDAKTDDFPGMDALYANAVFVHFAPEELRDCFERAREKLQHEKIIFFTVIKGEGSERSGRARGIERDFHYYSRDVIEELLTDLNYSILHLDDSDPKWMQVVCKVREG